MDGGGEVGCNRRLPDVEELVKSLLVPHHHHTISSSHRDKRRVERSLNTERKLREQPKTKEQMHRDHGLDAHACSL